MKKLVFFPSDPIIEYIKKGRSYEFLDEYYNPGNFFDEVYCLSPWGDNDEETIGQIHYIKASPFEFKKIIERIHPDIIRGYGGYCCSDWVSFNKVHGIPTVVSVHDTNPELIHDSLAYADGIICMSQAVKNAVERLVPNVTNNIWIMPNRIDTDIYSKKNNQSYFDELNQRFPGKKHILHVGRKTEQKNVDTVIKAMKYIENDVAVIFVGQGNQEIYQKLSKEEGVANRCFWVERVASEELPYWYSWCDCMCTPSRWEGFGYVFIEAAASETAIVTSNIAPMNEYLTNGRNAILVDDYENPVEIAKSINYVLGNTEEVRKLKHNAREVGLTFRKDVIDKKEISIYKQMLEIKANDLNYDELKKRLMEKEKKEMVKQNVYTFLKRARTDKIYREMKEKLLPVKNRIIERKSDHIKKK